MTVTAVVGLQWGDEAKGKFVDLLSPAAPMIVARFNGGDNAGHTVVNPLGTFKLRLTPNGFFNPKDSLRDRSGSGGQPGHPARRDPTWIQQAGVEPEPAGCGFHRAAMW